MFWQVFLFRVALVAALVIPTPFFLTQAHADENLWGYVYGTDTLPAGANEIYLWTTSRNLNGRSHQISGGALAEDPDRKLHRGLEFDGFNVEFKYNVLSVYKDLFGLS